MLDIYARHLEPGNDRRWRIEHAQVIHPQDLPRFGQLGVVPSVQSTHATSDMRWAGERLGTRLKHAYRYRELLEQNGWLPNGSDFPVEPIDPLRGFYAAVVRKDQRGYPEGGFQMENALTRRQALEAMTIWAARANFEEPSPGQPGAGEVGGPRDAGPGSAAGARGGAALGPGGRHLRGRGAGLLPVRPFRWEGLWWGKASRTPSTGYLGRHRGPHQACAFRAFGPPPGASPCTCWRIPRA